jgi:uncharacterized 2Fe-2S/4Fe-4S cluster protein (DUF4445 family)
MPFNLDVKGKEQTWRLPVAIAGPTLLEHLQNAGVPIRSSCMGKGTCHQCRVKVEDGVAPASPTDLKAFSKEEIQNGWRLSCMLRPRTALKVFFPLQFQFHDTVVVTRLPKGTWQFVCDLGTTGLEIAAVDEEGCAASIHELNRQVSMGADIMTRLEYAQKNGNQKLTATIQTQLVRMVNTLSQKLSSADWGGFRSTMYCAGNSVMTTLLSNLSIETLAVAPFEPETTAPQSVTVMTERGPLQLVTLPLFSHFIGGDLWAAAFMLWKQNQCTPETSWALVDIGTNSEILVWDGKSLFVSSTPAGPAFEGSNISIGMRAEPGAIIHPKFVENRWSFDVIGHDIPQGLCGTSLMEMIAEACRHALLKDDGEILDETKFSLTDSLSLTQADVREFQLAKSAIRAGLDLVIACGKRAPEKLYVAGAFGQHLPLNDCYELGLLPHLPITTLGNSSLAGGALWSGASNSERKTFEEWVAKVMTSVDLAVHESFQDAFIAHMSLRS